MRTDSSSRLLDKWRELLAAANNPDGSRPKFVRPPTYSLVSDTVLHIQQQDRLIAELKADKQALLERAMNEQEVSHV